MKSKVLVQYVAVVVVGVFALGIWLTGGELDVAWTKFFSIAVLLATAGVALWDHVLWSLRPFQRIPGVSINIKGTWKGTLATYWVDPQSGTTPAPKDVYVVIRQTASRVVVTVHTDESTSTSSLGVVSEDRGAWALDYMYLNQPALSVEARSRSHHGSCSLRITGSPPTKLVGRYWTDRDSKGEIELIARHSSHADDYTSAEKLF